MAFQDWNHEDPLSFSVKPIDNPSKILFNDDNEDVCLRIARFAKVPKLDFQKVRVNKIKRLKLDLYNPNNYPVVIYINKLVDSDFELEPFSGNSSGFDDEFAENDDDIAVGLDAEEIKSISVVWSPKSPGNVREVLIVKWEGGSKLQVVFLGTGMEEPVKKKAQKKVIPTLNKNLQSKMSTGNRKVLSAIQPETPSRRTTFSVNNPQNNYNDKENIPKKPSLESSLSPLSFEKKQPLVKSKKTTSSFLKPKTQGFVKAGTEEKENEVRRQTFSIKKEPAANRNLFGSKNNNIINNKLMTSVKKANTSSVSENDKPKTFLKRKSISQTIPKPNLQKGLAMKKLKLGKGPKTSMPRHPMPFAAKNMFYDERWIDKQERGFTNWLNYTLTPFEDAVDTPANKENSDRRETYTVDASKKQEVAPTREEVSFRTYSLRRRMAQLRRSACMCYQSEEFMFVIHKIEKEVECGLIAVRPEKHILADLGIKGQILKMLLSYNSLWLRIGLEVIYGEMILLHSNNDVHNLSKFVSTRLLANPDIAAAYSHPTVPNLFKPGYEETLAKFTLKKFLLLVTFLDHAKHKRLIDHDPCLFNKSSEVKATRDILLNFSKDFLKGEGDITKHLSYMGITIGHSQTALDEYDFGIKNIAVDLRDGVRLIRVVEMLTENWTLSSKVRLPAISRLQKVHNVGVAMECLKSKGLKFVQDAKCVVDGHREKTLLLLWQMIFHFQVGFLLDIEKLKEEVAYLSRRLKLRQELSAIESSCNQDDFLGLNRRDSFDKEDSLYFKSDKLCLLLKWCKSVCAHYDIKIENFTVSFSDGIAFCCLVNFYHPDILPKSLINHETTQTCSIAQQEDGVEDDFFYDNWTKCFSPNTGINRRLETLLNNEKENYRVLNESIHDLGGVPSMLRSADMSNTIPDEKVVITYVSYLCSRLLSIQKETRAARKIQLAWRKYSLSKKKDEFRVLHKAASRIQGCYRGYITRMNYIYHRECVIICQSVARRWLSLRHLDLMHAAAYVIQCVYRDYLETNKQRYMFLQMKASAVVIQKAYRQHLSKRVQLYTDAASIIQYTWRCYQARSNFNRVNHSATTIQKYWKGIRDRTAYRKQREACLVIQMQFRAWETGQATRMKYLAYRNSALKIQRSWRSHCEAKAVRESWLEIRSSTVRIQAWYKMVTCRRQLEMQKQSARVIQQSWRSFVETRRLQAEYVALRRACVVLQSTYRRRRAENQIRAENKAASVIQTRWRSKLKRDEDHRAYQKLKMGALCLQTMFRLKQTRLGFLRMKRSAVVIQRAYRSLVTRRQEYLVFKMQRSIVTVQSLARRFLARSEFRRKKSAAVAIQQVWRGHRSRVSHRDNFQKLRGAVVVLQSMHKMRVQRSLYKSSKDAATRIQSIVRMHQRRNSLLSKRESAIQIQAAVRMRTAKLLYERQRKAAVTIQSWYRKCVAREQYIATKAAVVKLQAWSRMTEQRTKFSKQKLSAVRIQSVTRRYIARSSFLEQKAAAVLIQASFRGFKERRMSLERINAAVKVQSLCKMYLVRKAFLQKIRSAVRIQTVVRQWNCQKKYSKSRSAAVLIQSVYRMRLARKRYNEMQESALLLQSFFRMLSCQKIFHRQKASAVKLQSIIRMYQCRTNFLQMQQSAVKIQSIFRMHQARACHVTNKHAAIMVQKHVRGYLARTHFSRQKNAAVKIQSHYKMHSAQASYRSKRNAVVKIQAVVKMHIVRCCYLSKRESAMRIQAAWRIHAQKKREYRHRVEASILLQSFARMCNSRNDFLRKRNAAVLVQSFIRMSLARYRFVTLKEKVVKIQSSFRKAIQRRAYLQQRRAVVTIQAWRRGCLQKRHFCQQKQAATCIQSLYRMHRVRVEYVDKQQAVVKIQSSWRMHKAQARYVETKQAAVVLQAGLRMFAARRSYVQKKHAAVKLQSAVRGYQRRRSFLQFRTTTVTIQSFVRMASSRSVFLHKKRAALRIQSAWRTRQQQRGYKHVRESAMKIQSVWRMYMQRTEFTNLVRSTVTIQSFVRMASSRSMFLHKKRAALRIQSAWRTRQQQRGYKHVRESAMKIQSIWRMYMQKSEFTNLVRSTVTLQSFSRMALAKLAYKRKCDSVLLLQANVRMWITRIKFLSLRRSCLQIQTWWRAASCRRTYCQQKNAAALLQRVLKGYLARVQYTEKRNATVTIQRFVRHVAETRNSKRRHEAATKIQSFVKMSVRRKRFLRQQSACIVIQQKYRAYSVGYRYYVRYNVIRGAVITIQALTRGYLVRMSVEDRKRNIVRAQALIRGKIVRGRYVALRSAVVVAQKNARMVIARRRYERTVLSVVKIQSQVRRIIVVKKLKKLAERHRAASTIQKNFKAAMAQKRHRRLVADELWKKQKAAACIQTSWRHHNERRRSRAAVFIQSLARRYLERCRFAKSKNAVSTIQSWYRASKQRDAARMEYLTTRRNIVRLQARVRTRVLRRRYTRTRESALVLQQWWRDALLATRLRREFIGKCEACLLIQSAYRSYKTRQSDEARRAAACKLNSFFKMFLTRQRFSDERSAAIQIQSVWRMSRDRTNFARAKSAVQCLERWYSNVLKGNRERQTFLQKKRAVLLIQRNYASYKLRVETLTRVRLLVSKTTAARIIESAYLSHVAMRQVRESYLAMKDATVVLQRSVRLYLCKLRNRRRNEAAQIIQKTFKSYISRKNEKELLLLRMAAVSNFTMAVHTCLSVLKIQRWYRRNIVEIKERAERKKESASLTLQSLWRGYVVRRQIKDARLKEARERIEAANSNATEPMKLCNRTRSALDYLLKVNNLSTVYEALKQLDVSTFLSFRCCERLIEDNALPVIFRIINYGNRSLPWISIKQVAFSILLNLAKCQSTYRAIYDEKQCMEILTDQMANFRDKKASIFPMACNLVTVLCYDDVIKKDLLGRSKIISKFVSFWRLSERKHKMDSKRNKLTQQEREQPYCKTAWHRRASSINSKDPHTSIQLLSRRLELIL